jgi:S1-C subfamily serine protease
MSRGRDVQMTFEGAGLLLAGVAITGQDVDGNRIMTFQSSPVVQSVVAGGIAERAGIRAGDIVRGVSIDVPPAPDLRPVTREGLLPLTSPQGMAALSSAAPGRPVLLWITRDGELRQVILQMN